MHNHNYDDEDHIYVVRDTQSTVHARPADFMITTMMIMMMMMMMLVAKMQLMTALMTV